MSSVCSYSGAEQKNVLVMTHRNGGHAIVCYFLLLISVRMFHVHGPVTRSPALILYIWPCLARHPKKVVHPQLFSVAPLAHCHYVAVRDADNEVLTLQLLTGLPPSFTARAIAYLVN
jgi:hypothetical protein